MAVHFKLHSQYPQARALQQITAALRDGAVMLYPTDTVYAIGCDVTHKQAVERVRRINQINQLVSTSAKLGGDTVGSLDFRFGQEWEAEEDRENLAVEDVKQLEKQVDLVLEDEDPYRAKVSTIDLTGPEPVAVRAGLGYDQVRDLQRAELGG